MNDNPAQQPAQSGAPNYVDAYSPPGQSTSMTQPQSPPELVVPTPSVSAPPQPFTQMTSPPASATDVHSNDAGSEKSETLEDQNIFFLLGVKDGTDQEKESFLDELQQVIWEDFLEYDVKLLITSDEMIELKKMLDSQTDRDLEKQEKIIVYLEKLIPDLEEIMLEKALELKEEMVRERVSGLRQFYADKPEKLQRVDEAERLLNENKWYTAAHLMNSLASS